MQDQQVEKQRENDETQRQIEEDTDREILELKNRYERQLRQEKEDNMKLKGDAGIMKKKVSTQISEQKVILFSYRYQAFRVT